MKKQKRRNHRIKKPVESQSHLRDMRLPGILAIIIVCLLLTIAFTNNHNTTATVAIAKPTPILRSSTSLSMNALSPKKQPTTGIFPLSTGGPIPVPANILLPTNIARIVSANQLTSIYAGSMARTPAIGVLAILQENLLTGQQSLHLYQTAQPVGALTILALRQSILTIASPQAKGTFNLSTHKFLF